MLNSARTVKASDWFWNKLTTKTVLFKVPWVDSQDPTSRHEAQDVVQRMDEVQCQGTFLEQVVRHIETEIHEPNDSGKNETRLQRLDFQKALDPPQTKARHTAAHNGHRKRHIGFVLNLPVLEGQVHELATHNRPIPSRAHPLSSCVQNPQTH